MPDTQEIKILPEYAEEEVMLIQDFDCTGTAIENQYVEIDMRDLDPPTLTDEEELAAYKRVYSHTKPGTSGWYLCRRLIGELAARKLGWL